jgi:hypothetical protein
MKGAEDGIENEARMLLEKDANINTKNAFGWTALHWAAVNGRPVVARLLLENGGRVGGENEGRVDSAALCSQPRPQGGNAALAGQGSGSVERKSATGAKKTV